MPCATVDRGLEIEPVNTKGSTENVALLEDGRVDIALVQGEVAHEALSGIGRPPADLKVIAAMYATAGLFVVRADLGYRTIGDLQGKPIAWGAHGSGLVVLGRYAVDGLGLDAARDFQPIYLERASDGPAMVLDGRVAALWGGGAGWPGFMAVASSDQGARFVAPSDDEIARILAKHSFLKRVTQPAGSFPGQAKNCFSRILELRDGAAALDESIAWRLAKACMTSKRTTIHRRSLPRRLSPIRSPRHRRAACTRASHAICAKPASADSTVTLAVGRRCWESQFSRSNAMDKKPGKDSKVEGEGSYSGTRAYNEFTAEFLKKGKVDEAAKAAEQALDSKEGGELEAADQEGRAGDPRHTAPGNMEKPPAKPKPQRENRSSARRRYGHGAVARSAPPHGPRARSQVAGLATCACWRRWRTRAARGVRARALRGVRL